MVQSGNGRLNLGSFHTEEDTKLPKFALPIFAQFRLAPVRLAPERMASLSSTLVNLLR